MQHLVKTAQFNITPNIKLPPIAHLQRSEGVTLNCVRTGVGRYNADIFRLGFCSSPACPCGHPEQTADHIFVCDVLGPPAGIELDLSEPSADTLTGSGGSGTSSDKFNHPSSFTHRFHWLPWRPQCPQMLELL